jgi:hypothetical protein
VCHQSVGLIARQLEASGIATLCMTSALDITRSVNPPRAAFLDYPLGHTAGKPHDPGLQRRILREALEGFESLTVPGSIKMLPFEWSEDEGWKLLAFAGDDTRTERLDTPQYQSEEDRIRAESGNGAQEAECIVCANWSGSSAHKDH